jgi:hypothetical protein
VCCRKSAEALGKNGTWAGKRKDAAMGANIAAMMSVNSFKEAGRAKKFNKLLRTIQVQ